MSTLGASVVIRNGNELDFCWRECINSLLPVCDTVCVCDGESTDGTQEEVRDWMTREPKLSLCVYPWPNPKGNPDFFVEWINYARQHVAADWHLQMDADEILSERSYLELRQFIQGPRRSALVTRYNFWQDHRHLIPDGVCLGKRVTRIAPQPVILVSDGYHPWGAEASAMAVPTGIEIFHYGFLRKPEAFFRKERLLQGYFFNTYDPRLEHAERHPESCPDGNWMKVPGMGEWSNRLDDYSGPHPSVAHAWLHERGYEP